MTMVSSKEFDLKKISFSFGEDELEDVGLKEIGEGDASG